MERFTISLDENLAREFDAVIAARGYSNRSEAVRDLIRSELLKASPAVHGTDHAIVNVSYVYAHTERTLAQRLAALQHDHHDLVVATLQTYIDHENCLSTVVLRGPRADVGRLAAGLLAQSGIRHGVVNEVPLQSVPTPHAHRPGGGRHHHHKPLL